MVWLKGSNKEIILDSSDEAQPYNEEQIEVRFCMIYSTITRRSLGRQPFVNFLMHYTVH